PRTRQSSSEPYGLVDRPDRPPRRVLADGQHGYGDVRDRIVTEDAADSDVDPFLPVGLHDVIGVPLELEPEAHHVIPRTACTVPFLRREELGGQSGTEEAPCGHGPVEAQEIADGDMGAAVGSSDRRIRVDVAPPADDATVPARLDPLGHVWL